MLQSHRRQEQLEQSNAELATSLAESQRNLHKFKNGEERLGKDQVRGLILGYYSLFTICYLIFVI
jgi:hypothetical protein